MQSYSVLFWIMRSLPWAGSAIRARPHFQFSKVTNCRGKDRRTNRFRSPPLQELKRGSAYAPLARAHSAAHMQLGRTPRCLGLNSPPGNIFATAYDCIGLRQRAQLGPRRKRAFESDRKASPPFARRLHGNSLVEQARGSITGNLTLCEGQIDPSDASRLAGAVDILDGGSLETVHDNRGPTNFAAEQCRQLEIRMEPVPNSEIVAGLDPPMLALANRH